MRIVTPLIALAAVGSLTASGCAISFDGPLIPASDLAGDSLSQDRDLDGFTSIALGGSADLVVTEGEAFEVTITADSALQEHISATVVDDTLRVSQDYTVLGSAPTVVVTVTVPDLQAVNLSGSSSATISHVRGGSVSVTVSGSADVAIDAEVQELSIDISGSGDITARGTATDLDVDISGSGDVNASGLRSRTARVDVTGSGQISVDASDSLDASITGSGEVIYAGSPRITSDVTGSGELRAASD